MSIDEYFLSRSDTMPPKKKSSKNECTASPAGLPLDAEELATASKMASVLDPALRQAIQEITDNISKVIDEKLSPLSQTLQAHALQLQNFGKREDKAEERTSGVEEASVQASQRIEALEKEMQSMAEHIDDLENRGRRKNIRVIGLPEGVESTHPTTFFESWLPDFLQMETKAGWIEIERAHHT